MIIFQDARHSAEGEIYTKLNQKIDEFIQLADYEWSMAESDGRASGYLMDLINFLRSTFQVFTHLPVSLILPPIAYPLAWLPDIDISDSFTAVKWYVYILFPLNFHLSSGVLISVHHIILKWVYRLNVNRCSL